MLKALSPFLQKYTTFQPWLDFPNHFMEFMGMSISCGKHHSRAPNLLQFTASKGRRPFASSPPAWISPGDQSKTNSSLSRSASHDNQSVFNFPVLMKFGIKWAPIQWYLWEKRWLVDCGREPINRPPSREYQSRRPSNPITRHSDVVSNSQPRLHNDPRYSTPSKTTLDVRFDYG